MAAQAEGLGDNGCEVLHQPFRLLVWKGKQKTWFLSVISPTRSHTSILKQYVSGRGKRWTVYVSGWSRQLGQACNGFSCQGLGPWSTAPSLPGQTLGKGGTSLQSLPYKWSQGMTGRSGHERAVGLRVGSQGCWWVTWNIYAKLKKKKKNCHFFWDDTTQIQGAGLGKWTISPNSSLWAGCNLNKWWPALSWVVQIL